MAAKKKLFITTYPGCYFQNEHKKAAEITLWTALSCYSQIAYQMAAENEYSWWPTLDDLYLVVIPKMYTRWKQRIKNHISWPGSSCYFWLHSTLLKPVPKACLICHGCPSISLSPLSWTAWEGPYFFHCHIHWGSKRCRGRKLCTRYIKGQEVGSRGGSICILPCRASCTSRVGTGTSEVVRPGGITGTVTGRNSVTVP